MRTNRILVSVAVALALVAGLAVQPANAQAKRRPRIAVMEFDYATVQTYSQAMFGSNVDIGKGITDLLITGLVKDGTYSIIERQVLDKLMTEQNFSNSNRPAVYPAWLRWWDLRGWSWRSSARS